MAAKSHSVGAPGCCFPAGRLGAYPSPASGRDDVARSCANNRFDFQKAGMRLANAALPRFKARGAPSFLPAFAGTGLPSRNVRERSAGRRSRRISRLAASLRSPPQEGVHASFDASASRRSTAAFARRPARWGSRLQLRAAFLESAFALRLRRTNAASSSRRAPSGTRAESRSRPSARGTCPRPQGPHPIPLK